MVAERRVGVLRDLLTRMGGLAERQVAIATQGLIRRDPALAQRAVAGDAELDALEHQVNVLAVEILGQDRPGAGDLRFTVAALKIAAALERIGDYAKSIGKRSLKLIGGEVPFDAAIFANLATQVQGNLKLAMDALDETDADKAGRIWRADIAIDQLHKSMIADILARIQARPDLAVQGAQLLFMAKNLERIGDHATTIAEMTYYAITGMVMSPRPKRPVADVPSPDDGVAGETPDGNTHPHPNAKEAM